MGRVIRARATAARTSPLETGIRRTSPCIATSASASSTGVDRRAVGPGSLLDDGFLLALRRVADPELEHEAVELRLGEGIGALLLDGVLGGEDEERLGQRIGPPARGHLVLLHGLEQRRLGLGRSAVDLVGQHDVGEDGSLHEAEGPAPRGGVVFEDVGAGDVAGHEVGSELDPAEREVERLGHRLHHERLGQPRHADQQRVPACQQGGEDPLDHFVLTDDAPGDLGAEGAHRIGQAGKLLDIVGDWSSGRHAVPGR